jgi:hypothetical protein
MKNSFKPGECTTHNENIYPLNLVSKIQNRRNPSGNLSVDERMVGLTADYGVDSENYGYPNRGLL